MDIRMHVLTAVDSIEDIYTGYLTRKSKCQSQTDIYKLDSDVFLLR